MQLLHKKLQVIFLVVFLASPFASFGQKETANFAARNTVYAELGGGSGRYAVNYSRIIYQKDKMKLNASAGFSMWKDLLFFSSRSSIWLPVIPLEISAFFGRSKHHLEIGSGFTSYLASRFQFSPDSYEVREKVGFAAFVPFRIGYRYQKHEGGFFYRVGYTPFLILPLGGRENSVFEYRFGSISFGKSF